MNRWNAIKVIAAFLTIIMIIWTTSKTINKYLDGHDDLYANFVYYTTKTDKRLDEFQKEINNNKVEIKYLQKIMENYHVK